MLPKGSALGRASSGNLSVWVGVRLCHDAIWAATLQILGDTARLMDTKLVKSCHSTRSPATIFRLTQL